MISSTSPLARRLLFRFIGSNEHEEDEVMKRTTVALAIVLSSMLLTGLASLASATLKPGQDIQAPRTGSEDIQSPRG
jgi:hypothetical protein